MMGERLRKMSPEDYYTFVDRADMFYRFIMEHEWTLRYVNGLWEVAQVCDEPDYCGSTDPFTAVIEAERYILNKEQHAK